MDFGSEAECSRIQIAKESIAEGCFSLDDIFYLFGVHFFPRDGLQQAQIIHLVLGNLASLQDLGPAEEIALKMSEPSFLARDEFFARLDLLSQHATTRAPETLHQGDALFRRGFLHVDLEEVCELDQFGARIIRDKVIERDR